LPLEKEMTTKSVGNIRLAAGDGRSDLLYNAYHLLTQLSAMYTHFTSHAQSPEHKQVYENLSVDILTDIGDLYVAWEVLDKNSKPVREPQRLAKTLVLTCNQLFRVIALTDAWTSFVKTTTLAGFLERKWLRVLKALKENAGKESAVLSELSKRAEARAHTVSLQLEKVKTHERQTQKAFDTAEMTLLEKTFGF
jgi:hypothetical protein